MCREGQYYIWKCWSLYLQRQWCVIGGCRSPWLYIDSVLLIAAASYHLQGLHPAIFSTRSAWHFCSKGAIHLWLLHTLGPGGFNPFPIHWNLWAVFFLSQYTVPSIQQLQTHFCELHVRHSTPSKIRRTSLRSKNKNYAKNAFQLKCRLDFPGTIRQIN